MKLFEDEKRELEMLNDEWERSARILEFSKQDLEERLYQAEENAIMYKEELDEIQTLREEEVQRLKDECKELKQELSLLRSQSGNLERIQQLETQLERVTKEKQALKAPKVAQTSSIGVQPNGSHFSNTASTDSLSPCSAPRPVKVIARFRPLLGQEKSTKCLECKNNSVTIIQSARRGQQNKKVFDFEKVFTRESSSFEVFEEVKESVEEVGKHGKACIIAYGQTGSGKTYTMNCMISESLNLLSVMVSGTAEVSLNCIEVYNEQVKNLLGEETLTKNFKELIESSRIKLQNDWVSQAKHLIETALQKRTTKYTDCNERSSRSHCIISLEFRRGGIKVGKIQFVDLAGSERVGKSNVTGDTLKETLLINKSLSALQDVIAALENKQQHIPFRNSILTKLLQSTLESQVTMILNCSSASDSLGETLSTLSLGSRLKAVDLAASIRKSLKTQEVERTLSLLEKERVEKNNILRSHEKLERDVEGYVYAIKDKDSKINALTNRLKQREKMHTEECERLRKELLSFKARHEEVNKKLRVFKSQIETEKQAKTKALKQLQSKDEQIKRVYSASPRTHSRRPPSAPPISCNIKSATPSRIPCPKH